jgi:hypothetical protein
MTLFLVIVRGLTVGFRPTREMKERVTVVPGVKDHASAER